MCLSEIPFFKNLTSCPFGEFEEVQVLNGQHFFMVFLCMLQFFPIYFPPFSNFFPPVLGLFFEELLWISEGFHFSLADPSKQSAMPPSG